MKRLLLLSLIFTGCSALSPLQKSKFISVTNLINEGKFTDAKDIVEELTTDETSSKWPRSWFMKGSLCQTAYLEGQKKNDKKLQELYPDQLYLAFESYEKAASLDNQGKLDRQLAPNLVILANEFQKLGESNYNGKRFNQSLKAFEYALRISENPILSVEIDTNLIYNTALAAYEGKNWDKATLYLTKLHNYKYSINATHLLFLSNLERGDSLAAQNTLLDGINRYEKNEDLVLLLTDLLFKNNDIEGALKIIDAVIVRNPTNPKLYNTKGLVYQKSGQYQKAIEAYSQAIQYSPNDVSNYISIATSYYNIGVEIDEGTRTISNNRMVQEQKAKSAAAFKSAAEWLDKAYSKGLTNPKEIEQIIELYKSLQLSDRVKSIENLIN
jgi:tetratricopeptide (TPR) repeat protein